MKNSSSDLSNDISITNGLLGEALFFSHYGNFKKDGTFLNHAYSLFDKSLAICIENLHSFGLSQGISGLGWYISHMVKNDYMDADVDEIFSEIDDTILNHLHTCFKNGNLELLNGVSGIGLFLLERPRNKKTDEIIEFIITQLYKNCIVDEEFAKWNDYNFQLNKPQQDVYNFGISHGIPGILSFLSKAAGNSKNGRLEELIQKSVNFLLKNQLDAKKSISLFPYGVGGHEKRASRLAWCYGDLGICCALWHAYEKLQSDRLKHTIIKILHHNSKRRDLKENGIMDACLCHGTSGIASIFLKMYQKSGINSFRETATYWITQTLNMDTFKDGITGYKTYHKSGTQEYYVSDRGLLEGVSGIGLSMLSFLSEDDLEWGKLLCIS